MSCCGTPRPVNPERPGEPGRWVLPVHQPWPDDYAGCRHASEYRNTLGIVGGPVAKVCIKCGEVQHPTWVPDVPARPALPAPEAFIVGESEWAHGATPQGRGAA